jgi:hypothetical protein
MTTRQLRTPPLFSTACNRKLLGADAEWDMAA